MTRLIEFTKTIRGTEVTVFADHFDGDPSTGMEIGPEEVWARTLDGSEFELTDEEQEHLGIEATEAYLNDWDD